MTDENNNWLVECLASCEFGDRRLTERAMKMGQAFSVKYGQPFSIIFDGASALKRAYEFLANPKTSFKNLTQPHHQQTAREIGKLPTILSVGDTTFLDYEKIIVKRDEYGPIGSGGNGLILHSSLAVHPENGQPLGLLWSKLWHREPLAVPPKKETLYQKKKRLAATRKVKRKRFFEEKESYRWVEAMLEVQHIFNEQKEASTSPKVIHVFDREGDISEVFERVSQNQETGVLVRAAHDRSLNEIDNHLWEYLCGQPIEIETTVELSATKKRTGRTAQLAVRFCPVNLRAPSRLKNQESFPVYAVFASEINPPFGEDPITWMLLTTELVTTPEEALQILRWYTYRWRVEDYHQILKSGCKVESYRLGGASMEVLLGFLTAIAAQLLKITYLNRTSPEAPAHTVLRPVQLEVLLAQSQRRKSLPKMLTVAWAIEAVARLGGYLEHRRDSAIGITVLWRGWLQLESLCQGWELHDRIN
jgi:Transposase DNA-binding